MTQYNALNIKLSNLQFNKLKSGIKSGTEITLNLSSNLIKILMMKLVSTQIMIHWYTSFKDL